jgi:acyl-CoA thioester hydrolase
VRHVYECPVRWADLDALGHVNNVVYVDYLQEARVDMFRSHRVELMGQELVEGLVVARTQVRYREPLLFRFEPVRIECWVTEIRAASFTLAYEVHDVHPDGSRTVYLTATTELTPYVFAEERPRRLTAQEKAVLEGHRDPAAQAPERSPGPTQPRRSEVGHYPVQVRFSDVDVYGHVNNVKYFEYLQEARIAMMGRLWDEVPGSAERSALVVAQVDVDYKVPILHRAAAYDAWTWVSHVGSSSLVMETEIVDGQGADGEVLLARARVVLVFFDPATGRPRRPEDDIRAPLLEVMSPSC